MSRATHTTVIFISRLSHLPTHRKELASDPSWLWPRALGHVGQGDPGTLAGHVVCWVSYRTLSRIRLTKGPPRPGEMTGGWHAS